MASVARIIALCLWWLLLVPCLLWTISYIQFFFVQPRNAQVALFGRQIVGLSSLRAARNDCCILTGDGRVEWTYEMTSDVAAMLRSRCQAGRIQYRPDGCRVAEQNFDGVPQGVNGGLSAIVSGNQLIIAVDWL